MVILMLEALKRLVEAGIPNIPSCYIMNSNTRREMPMIDNYLAGALIDIQVFIAINKLPVEVIQVEPSVSGRWTWTCLGRGKLPRFPGQSNDCSVDEKIIPMQRKVRDLERETGNQIVSLVGSRYEESQARKESMHKYQMSELAIVDIDGRKTYSIIADWYLDDVWELITGCSGTETSPPKLFRTFRNDFDELVGLYRDANDGQCAVLIDGSSKKACGSRFGCAWCTVSGDRDKSLESMVKEDEEKYGFMNPLLKFREFLISIRFDMSRRDFRGRNISPAKHMKVVPDYFL
ncbi:hypothetical protein [Vibrio sp. 1180_3]|uniref:hypothetical protein n=1 Tax=Vibrio sp. 1180_3 TaxID=2528832 RepID=UPI0024050A3B|nr:hypothetical protein [Vibrio sp. 1180_3]MDF9399150.1 hypothetical protein [Vibrio sp. 1180_3]